MKADGRADWCALPQQHGRHGEDAKGGACPGWGGKAPDTNGERRMRGISKRTVESTLQHVNDQLRALGMVRRYEFVAGSSAGGVKHLVQTRLPDLDHPTDLLPFPTLAKVYLHLTTVSGALKDVAAERDRARRVAVNGHPGISRSSERRNETDEPELVDWDAYPHNQAD